MYTTPVRTVILLAALLAVDACVPVPPGAAPVAANAQGAACPVTEPEWVKPPEDAAVLNEPEPGYYLVNADRSIWASAWWTGQKEFPLRATDDGNKVGWFRPAGATLELTGRRLDAPAAPMEAHVPCCYPTRFQSSSLYFPAEGCWEVTARSAGSEFVFVVRVEP